ncbi:Uncharacterised protein [Buttiauxella agrestis]|uniref:Uncharacterized protein n=1 Tax=Buttiauxella agrestis TaxID=82977 RepID=A0A381C6L8_9ENTR|nr:Uncharacterised protein [Buttiauxella agrestis]
MLINVISISLRALLLRTELLWIKSVDDSPEKYTANSKNG